jgi:hypothetical protein
VNLLRCQRYYQILGGAAISYYIEAYIPGNTVFLLGNARHIVNMRSAPSVSLTGSWVSLNMTGSSPTFSINDNNFTTYWLGGVSAGRSYYHLNTSSTLNFNAEL